MTHVSLWLLFHVIVSLWRHIYTLLFVPILNLCGVVVVWGFLLHVNTAMIMASVGSVEIWDMSRSLLEDKFFTKVILNKAIAIRDISSLISILENNVRISCSLKTMIHYFLDSSSCLGIL